LGAGDVPALRSCDIYYWRIATQKRRANDYIIR